ncbi:LrgB family protein [Viridibacillus sp. YIM B01967]|uniref:LrgB family protein n=1 Tax=Viridibacillus soli TaxID=2798301 RepID=A0ABS1H7L6_9BACL|nr:LrgB family protein [Viridibacillus soli]MBK3495409.1 LrgB family protein [Viridibacillus soli]
MKVIAIILITIVIYYLMTKLYARYSTPFLLPILTTTIIGVLLLMQFDIPYETYMTGGKWIDVMLGPAVVSLTYPLYTQRDMIKKYKLSIISSVVIAMISGLISIFSLAKLMRFDDGMIRSLLPKSITTPVAMQISDSLGGVPPMTAVFVMIAGFTGAILGPFIFRVCKIESAVSRGVSMGSGAHGFGVSKLTEYGEKTLSMGSVSMTLSAVIGAFICPLFALLIF